LGFEDGLSSDGLAGVVFFVGVREMSNGADHQPILRLLRHRRATTMITTIRQAEVPTAIATSKNGTFLHDWPADSTGLPMQCQKPPLL
jgi:hypothetical protein